MSKAKKTINAISNIANVIYLCYSTYNATLNAPSVFLNGIIAGMVSSSKKPETMVLNPKHLIKAEAQTEFSLRKKMQEKAAQMKADLQSVYQDRIKWSDELANEILNGKSVADLIAEKDIPSASGISATYKALASIHQKIDQVQTDLNTTTPHALSAAVVSVAMKEISNFGFFLGSTLQKILIVTNKGVVKDTILCIAMILNFVQEITKGIIFIPLDITASAFSGFFDEVGRAFLKAETPEAVESLENAIHSFSEFKAKAKASLQKNRQNANIQDEYIGNYHRNSDITRRSVNLIGNLTNQEGWYLSKSLLGFSDSIRSTIIGGSRFISHKLAKSSKNFANRVLKSGNKGSTMSKNI